MLEQATKDKEANKQGLEENTKAYQELFEKKITEMGTNYDSLAAEIGRKMDTIGKAMLLLKEKLTTYRQMRRKQAGLMQALTADSTASAKELASKVVLLEGQNTALRHQLEVTEVTTAWVVPPNTEDRPVLTGGSTEQRLRQGLQFAIHTAADCLGKAPEEAESLVDKQKCLYGLIVDLVTQ